MNYNVHQFKCALRDGLTLRRSEGHCAFQRGSGADDLGVGPTPFNPYLSLRTRNMPLDDDTTKSSNDRLTPSDTNTPSEPIKWDRNPATI